MFPIIADFSDNDSLILSTKQFPLEFFKSVAFFLGHPVDNSYNLSGFRKAVTGRSSQIVDSILKLP